MELVATPTHIHDPLRRCDPCYDLGSTDGYRDGKKNGYDKGYETGYGYARELTRSPESVKAETADEIVEVVSTAHRRAGHGGRWDLCHEPVCAAVEEWVHDQRKAVQ